LSLQRAESVKAYLIKQGIAAHRIKTKGYGKRRPIAENGTEWDENSTAGRNSYRFKVKHLHVSVLPSADTCQRACCFEPNAAGRTSAASNQPPDGQVPLQTSRRTAPSAASNQPPDGQCRFKPVAGRRQVPADSKWKIQRNGFCVC
jgi:hypothetical protein